MIEILGADLDKTFAGLGINATKTYQCANKYWTYQEDYQVWEVSEQDFEKLCAIKLSDWPEDGGWWRYAKGSVMDNEIHRFIINNHYIKAWDDNREKHAWKSRKYKCLLQYFSEELNLGTETNVNALSVDLAKMNNMKMSELWQKYMG